MKEFIEKLIGRFRDCTTIEDYGELFVSLDEVENIICELAEEYNNDFCEWKMFKANARLRHKNCMFAEDTVDPWKFNFCPYCGKKIKVVE